MKLNDTIQDAIDLTTDTLLEAKRGGVARSLQYIRRS